MHEIHALDASNHIHSQSREALFKISYKVTHVHTHKQDRQVSEWLRILMRDGQSAIDEFISNPVSIKQRLLAEQYQRAVDAAAGEERMAHV